MNPHPFGPRPLPTTPASTIVRLRPNGATEAEAANDRAVAETLRSAGYQTWHLGQWHRPTGRPWQPDTTYDVVVRCAWWHAPYDCDATLTEHLVEEVIGAIETSGDAPMLITVVGCPHHLPITDPHLDLGRIRGALERVGRQDAYVELVPAASRPADEVRTMAG